MKSLSLDNLVEKYIHAMNLTKGTSSEYDTTVRKWNKWGRKPTISDISRSDLHDFLEWVHHEAVKSNGGNPGRTSNKARENLKAVLSWAVDSEFISALPRFPRPVIQRSVAGRHYLTKSELNSLYFATYQLKSHSSWPHPFTMGHYWRSALVLFFDYGLDTGTIWGSKAIHEPILWRHIVWDQRSPDGPGKQESRWGWLSYRRTKTSKLFIRPMNRVVYSHIKYIEPKEIDPNLPVLFGGGCRPNEIFKKLCEIAGIRPKLSIEADNHNPWQLKDLRKTCATYYDQHIPESSIEILGHSVGGITYRHYAHRDPLAFKAISTIPQPTAFLSIAKGFDGECPCCRRRF